MTFIGGSPPPTSVSIQNGNFSQPTIQNDSSTDGIRSASTVPGWNFVGACVINNSSAWGYPMPYPNGNQCCSIQATAYIEQIINLSTGTYYLSFIACGRPGYSGATTLDIQLNGETFYSVTPPTTEWIVYKSSFSVTTSGNNIIRFLGTTDDVYNSTAFQGILLENSGVSTPASYTYDMCKNTAIDSGYKYFGLQNVNTETSKGYCAVSNDAVGVTQKGISYAVNKVVPLWDSKTNGTGAYAYLTNQGTLTVYNSPGGAVYNTDNSRSQPSNYLGCYLDKSTRAMPYLQGRVDSYDACKKKATDNGAAPYFGLQDSPSGTNIECWLASSIDGIRDYGRATNCTKLSNGIYSGGGWSNAIYSLDSTSFYYLVVQDDGNMCIYRGSGPDDNQGDIWCSWTNGQQKKANPAYAAAKGKYGKNWIPSGTGLSPGDWVGSTDGSTYLIMQTDGNLVLYTSENGENCQKR
jgi:hypothetical protein